MRGAFRVIEHYEEAMPARAATHRPRRHLLPQRQLVQLTADPACRLGCTGTAADPPVENSSADAGRTDEFATGRALVEMRCLPLEKALHRCVVTTTKLQQP